MRRREMSGSYRFAARVLRPLLRTITRQDWRGAENLPRTTGFVVCPNHISFIDPLTLAHFLFDNGLLPRYLIKDSLFRLPVLHRIFAGAGQIPVYRETDTARSAYSAAVAAVRSGECVVMYPEGTLTRDPGLWPMRGKTGAARVALETGCPVIPVVQWGPQRVLAPYRKVPHLLPPRPVLVQAGSPVDLSRFQRRLLEGHMMDGRLLHEATDAILDDLTAMLAAIRCEAPPATRWNPRLHGQPATGNPKGKHR